MREIVVTQIQDFVRQMKACRTADDYVALNNNAKDAMETSCQGIGEQDPTEEQLTYIALYAIAARLQRLAIAN